jgi:hypothetical protein
MPFNFNQVYRLRVVSDNYYGLDFVALGVKPGTQQNPDTDQDEAVIEFVTNSYDNKNHFIFGDVVKDEGGVIDVVDRLHQGFESDDPVVVWRFEPLTLHNWSYMSIGGYDDLRQHFTSDEELRTHYRHDFLPEWWTE